jgi:hypothetical protein
MWLTHRLELQCMIGVRRYYQSRDIDRSQEVQAEWDIRPESYLPTEVGHTTGVTSYD